jgi:hypothetical protein
LNYALWNTLHDGCIKSVEGTIPGDVTITVDISYLCEKLPTVAKHLKVHLQQCSCLEFQPFQGGSITEFGELASCGVEILSAGEEGNFVNICCANGSLKLAYMRAETHLAEGSLVTQTELEAAADTYWKEWSLKNAPKKLRSDPQQPRN